MKKILFTLLAVLICVSAFAEPGARKEEKRARKDSLKAAEMIGAHRKGTKIKLDGTVLTKEQQSLLLSNINMEDYNEEWSQYRKQRHLGNGLAITGTTFIVAGAAAEVAALGYIVVGAIVAAFTFGQASDEEMDKIFRPAGVLAASGLAAAGVGVGTMAVGVPIRVKADKKMKAICDEYNVSTERVEKEVIFGTTSSGVGIAFNF